MSKRNQRLLKQGKRWCPKCSSARPLAEFTEFKGRRQGYCKDCRKVYGEEYREGANDIQNAKHLEYAKNNREIINKAQRRWREKNPDYYKNYYHNVIKKNHE